MAALDLIQFACPACGHTTQVPAISAGSTITCPGCKSQQPVVRPVTQDPPAQPPSPPVSFTPSGGHPIIDDGKKLFICSCCSYRARIPAQYLGMAVRCPSCDAPQIASGDENAVRSGRTVSISKMQTAAQSQAKMSSIRPGNILYTCNLCGFEAQLAQHYLGKAIRCPGCHAPQVVAEGITAKVPGATTAPAVPAESPPPPATPPPPGITPPPAPPPAAATEAPTTHDGQPLFVCSACGYRARIPEQYLGLAVTCPSCEVVQIANQQATEQPSTGNTQRIAKLKTAEPVDAAAAASATDGDKVPFTCTACGFNTQLGGNLAGKAIRCPSCQATQVVPGRPGVGFDKPSPIPAAMSAGIAPAADKVRFTCTSCGFKARIPAHYAGQVIHCPGCNSVQLVVASALASTGNTRVLAKVQTADGKPAAPTSADELKSVSTALEASTRAVPPPVAVIPAPSPARGQPVIPPPVAKPATGRVVRGGGTDRMAKPATATIAKPATGSFPRPGTAPVAKPADGRPGNAPVNQATAQPATDSHKPTTDLVDRPEIQLESKPATDLFSRGGVVDDTPKAGTGGKVVRRSGATAKHASDPAIPATRPKAGPVPVPATQPADDAAQDPAMSAPAPARSTPIVGILLAVVALAIIGGMGWFLVDSQKQFQIRLDKISLQLEAAQKKADEESAKREAAEKAAEKDKAEAAKRVEEMQRQLKEAEDKAAREKAERERIEKERTDAAAAAAAAAAKPAEAAPAPAAPTGTPVVK